MLARTPTQALAKEDAKNHSKIPINYFDLLQMLASSPIFFSDLVFAD